MSHPVDSPRLHSYPAEDMDCYRVSKLVNNARNDSPDCITAVQKPLFWTAVMRINYGLTPFPNPFVAFRKAIYVKIFCDFCCKGRWYVVESKSVT